MLTATTATDPANAVTVVTLRGSLTVDSAPAVRTALLKSLADGPEAVLVDVSGLSVDRPARLTVFPAALRASDLRATVMLLFGASTELIEAAGGGALGAVGLCPTLEDALATAAARQPPPSVRRHRLTLSPDPSAAARARALVTLACQRWDVPHLAGPATQVVSELVSNAVEHAGPGDIHLAVAMRGNYLHLSVRDHSQQVPVPADRPDPRVERGRGMFLVDVYATAWGCNPAAKGKIVWATLRARPVTAGGVTEQRQRA